MYEKKKLKNTETNDESSMIESLSRLKTEPAEE